MMFKTVGTDFGKNVFFFISPLVFEKISILKISRSSSGWAGGLGGAAGRIWTIFETWSEGSEGSSAKIQNFKNRFLQFQTLYFGIITPNFQLLTPSDGREIILAHPLAPISGISVLDGPGWGNLQGISWDFLIKPRFLRVFRFFTSLAPCQNYFSAVRGS